MEVQQCEFVGPGPNIFCWYYDENLPAQKNIISERKIIEHYNSFSLLG